MAWKLYTDAACTVEFVPPLEVVHRTDFSDNPQDFTLYYANVDQDLGDIGSHQKQANSNPGVDPILFEVVDAAPGSGHEAGEVTLATSSAGLDTATAGASLDLGTTLLSGVSNAQPVHIRIVNQVASVGTSTELSVDIVATVDSEV